VKHDSCDSSDVEDSSIGDMNKLAMVFYERRHPIRAHVFLASEGARISYTILPQCQTTHLNEFNFLLL
jgi:hypothetical protein